MRINPSAVLAIAAIGTLLGSLIISVDRPPSWGLWIALGFLQIPVAIAAYTVLHDASHRVAGRARWANELLLFGCGMVFLTDGLLFRRVHLLHHAHTHRPNDPDRFTSARSRLARLVRSMLIAVGYYTYAVRTLWREPVWRKRLIVAAVLPIVVTAFFAWLGRLDVFLLLWLLPTWLAEGLMGLLFSSLPHDHEQDQTRNLTLPPVVGWLLGNGHLHLAHHEFPRVPWYRLPRFWREHASIGVASTASRSAARLVR